MAVIGATAGVAVAVFIAARRESKEPASTAWIVTPAPEAPPPEPPLPMPSATPSSKAVESAAQEGSTSE